MSQSVRGKKNCTPCRKRKKGGCGSKDAILNKGCLGLAPAELDRAHETVTRATDRGEEEGRSTVVSEQHHEAPPPATASLPESERLFTDVDEAALSALRNEVAASKQPRGKRAKRKRRRQKPVRSLGQQSAHLDQVHNELQSSLRRLENELQLHLAQIADQPQRHATERASLEQKHAEERVASQNTLRCIQSKLRQQKPIDNGNVRALEAIRTASPAIDQLQVSTLLVAPASPSAVQLEEEEVAAFHKHSNNMAASSPTHQIDVEASAPLDDFWLGKAAASNAVVDDVDANGRPVDDKTVSNLRRWPLLQAKIARDDAQVHTSAPLPTVPTEASLGPHGAFAPDEAAAPAASQDNGSIGPGGLRLPHRSDLTELLELQELRESTTQNSSQSSDSSGGQTSCDPQGHLPQRPTRFRSVVDVGASLPSKLSLASGSNHARWQLLDGWAAADNLHVTDLPASIDPRSSTITTATAKEDKGDGDATLNATVIGSGDRTVGSAVKPRVQMELETTTHTVNANPKPKTKTGRPGWIAIPNAESSTDRSFFLMRQPRHPPRPVRRGFSASIFERPVQTYQQPASSPSAAADNDEVELPIASNRAEGAFVCNDARIDWSIVRSTSTTKRLLKAAIPNTVDNPKNWQQAITNRGMTSRVQKASLRYLGHSFARKPDQVGPVAELARLRNCWGREQLQPASGSSTRKRGRLESSPRECSAA